MFRRCAPALGVVLLLCCLSAGAACADEKVADVVTASADQASVVAEEIEKPAGEAAVGETPAAVGEKPAAAVDLAPVLEMLVAKKVITPQEAATLKGQGGEQGNPKALIELLRGKGVISEEEAAKLNAGALPPSRDQQFIASLRETWVKNGNRRRDFDEWFAGNSDPDDIIGRMRVMGAISAEEADRLSKEYRDNYLSGVVAATLDHKEQQYLERVRKDVAFDLDEKIKEEHKNDWSRRLRLFGDVRLRYEGDFFDANNGDFLQPSNPTQLMNSHQARNRMRLRARLGVDAVLTDRWQAEIALATDNSSSSPNPGSDNVTLGNFFNKKAIYLDKAFLKWSPGPTFYAEGGRFNNPFLCTDMLWANDLNLDGIAFSYAPQIGERTSLFLTGGAFPLQEVDPSSYLSAHDKWMFAAQLGVTHRTPSNVTGSLAVAYYDFVNTVGEVNNPAQPGQKDWSAPLYQQKGNTLMDIDPGPAIKTAYASAFRELDVIGVLDLGLWDPAHFILTGDYVRNLGFDKGAVSARTGFPVSNEIQGYQVGYSVGYPLVRDRWEWRQFFYYRYLESDAVMDAFNDQDFHLGGTNTKGWVIGGELGVAKNVWFTTRWLSGDEISGPPLSIDVFQLDLNARF
jgi:hypothetical protein